MDTKLEAKRVMNLYRRFLAEHGVTPETVYANILWLWPEYLAKNS